MSDLRTSAGRALAETLSLGTILTREGRETRIAVIEAESGEIDAAWAEAEAALPEGWSFGLRRWTDGSCNAWVSDVAYLPFGHFDRPVPELEGKGDTPAAALHALAANLRG